MGDNAADIAEIGLYLPAEAPLPQVLTDMADQALAMEQAALDAFLKGSPENAKQVIAMDDKQDELFNKKRTQNIAFPRQVAMYLCRELADLSYPRIGELFGGRDHTTVIHAYEKISNFKNSNLAFQNELQEIIEILRQ